jgi:hypothetical protein
VIPVWEEVHPSNVAVLKEIMASRKSSQGLDLQYVRIPITSERPPDFADISELMDLVLRADSSSTVMVVNCQLGRGRSTLTSVSADVIETLFIEVVVTQVLIILIQQWLKESRAPPQRSPRAKPRQLSMSMTSDMFHEELANKRQSYQVINSALSAPFLRYID